MKIGYFRIKVYYVLSLLFILFSACSTGTKSTIPNVVVPGADELDMAILESSDYLNERIPQGDKVAFVSARQNFPALTEYIIDSLIENAVNDRVFSVVDRAQLDAIRSEIDFQMSGDVSDESARSLGRLLGANTIVTVTASQVGTMFRLGIRALEVESAEIQGQINRNIPNGLLITSLATGSSIGSAAVASARSSTNQAGQTIPPVTSQTPSDQTQSTIIPIIPPIEGTIVPGSSLTEKFAWLQGNAESHGTYIIEINASENISPQRLEYRNMINITIVLRGDEENRFIRLSSNGTMFTINANVNLVLDNNITLQGHSGNNGPIVCVDGGVLRMRNGSTITGNVNNHNLFYGGGVNLRSGVFEMSGGTISNNTAQEGGGVWVSGTFNMMGGTISENEANKGGGVYVQNQNFFNMRGGIITNNTATNAGGGVYMHWIPNFTKSAGIITGYNSDAIKGNSVKDNAGNIIARMGHAVYVEHINSIYPGKRKETTSSISEQLSATMFNSSTRFTGAWDN